MTRIAIPVSEDLLSARFSDCSHFLVYDIHCNEILKVSTHALCFDEVQQVESWMTAEGITDVIVHFIAEAFVSYLTTTKVNLYLGVELAEPDQLVAHYINGTLKSNARNFMPEAPLN